MEKKLNAAVKLISGLGSEQKRWTIEKQRLGECRERLVGDCLLCSSFLSYVGPFNADFRKLMVFVDWKKDILDKKIPFSEEFRLNDLLCSEVTIS